MKVYALSNIWGTTFWVFSSVFNATTRVCGRENFFSVIFSSKSGELRAALFLDFSSQMPSQLNFVLKLWAFTTY